ncbi:DNA-binding XRE family transcriptional regulator [Virgibacillus halotolerans]|uniref:helix-turn-helix domain-containing protein n=1 Tax=Virgibacillus halotolerans TaxID=1071053 RepID=UPI0019602F04|nr:helix-turn-helix transcriptional regulator [Virgibacillus halotolerans]MBM7598022.1 DNA-binding XRE family transcriptional regulator [Virgibacillus halotolerans]
MTIDFGVFKAIRTLNSLTQTEMAARLGVSQQLIGFIETKYSGISPKVERRFIEEFGKAQIEYVRTITDVMKSGEFDK